MTWLWQRAPPLTTTAQCRTPRKCCSRIVAAPQLLHYICQANWRPSVTQPTVGRDKILYSQTTHNCNCPKVALRKKASLTFSQLFRFQQILIFDADLSLCRAGIPLWDFNLYNSHVLSFPNGGNIWLALSTGSGLGAGSPKYPLITVIQGSYVNCPASGDSCLRFLVLFFCICICICLYICSYICICIFAFSDNPRQLCQLSCLK